MTGRPQAISRISCIAFPPSCACQGEAAGAPITLQLDETNGGLACASMPADPPRLLGDAGIENAVRSPTELEAATLAARWISISRANVPPALTITTPATRSTMISRRSPRHGASLAAALCVPFPRFPPLEFPTGPCAEWEWPRLHGRAPATAVIISPVTVSPLVSTNETFQNPRLVQPRANVRAGGRPGLAGACAADLPAVYGPEVMSGPGRASAPPRRSGNTQGPKGAKAFTAP